MANIFDVASFFINSRPGTITHLKLQKLLYYAQAWHMVWNEKHLFDEEFEAWVYGPVSEVVYREYNNFGYQPIIMVDNYSYMDNISKEENDTLKLVDSVYGVYDANFLKNLTHSEDPWNKAREGYRLNERCTEIISKESMHDYYSQIVQREDACNVIKNVKYEKAKQDFNAFFDANQDLICEKCMQNSNYDDEGNPTLAPDDDWRHDNVWDSLLSKD